MRDAIEEIVTPQRLRKLSAQDRRNVFLRATSGFASRYAEDIRRGMTNAALARALRDSFGISGGTGGPFIPSEDHAGAGLRIWGGWSATNLVLDTPLFAGDATIAMAREVYAIRDPDDKQLALF